MRVTDDSEIRSLRLFREMADDGFEDLMRGAYVQTFPPQVDLIVEGDPCDFFHIVVDGRIELFATWNGRETTMGTVRPVASFILAATIKDAPYLMSARTIEKSRVVLIPSLDVRAAFSNDPAFSRAIVLELATCYRNVVKHSKDLKLRNSVERLANYLLRQYRGQGSTFELQMEKRRLASFLGMTPENLSRSIKALQAYGVEVNGMSVTLTNLPDLERLAKPTPLIDDTSE